MLKAEIRIKGQAPKKYERLAKNLSYQELKRAAEYAIEKQNIQALSGIAKVNPYAVKSALFFDKNMQILGRKLIKESGNAPDLYFLLRGVLDSQQKKIFRRLARSVILKSSIRIAGAGIRGETWKRMPYTPGIEDFDIDLTLENYLEQGYLNYDTVVVIERRERKKTGLLIVDTSGSMIENKITIAALAAAVMAYHMRKDNYAVISFNTIAFILKKFGEKISTTKLVDQILDTTAAGYTNIYDALEKGLGELKKVRKHEKWTILITDGVYNRGGDPLLLASKYNKLNVIGLPSNDPNGPVLCEKIAKKGGGRYLPLKSYKEIPIVLSKILKKPWK
ncbi:MAG: vWA domain-containing protein [Candidatus Odinarchaeia archaeon]